MKHRGRTLVALLLTLCLVLALLPAAALAADEGPCTVTYEPNDPEHLYLDELNPAPLYLAYTAGEQAKVMPSVGNNCTVWYRGLLFSTKSGFVFKEWNTAADGSGKSYQEGDILAEAINGNITLYAIWAKAATLVVTNRIVLPDDAPEVMNLPRFYSFLLNGQAARDGSIEAYRDLTSPTPFWRGETQNPQGAYLVPGTDLALGEEFYNIAYIGDYELEKVEYYVNGSQTPIVWSSEAGKPDVPMILRDGVTQVDVVNTYKKSDLDVQAKGVTLQHQIAQSDAADWDGDDTAAHKATVQQPEVNYRMSVDLNALTLTESGKNNLGELTLREGQTLWAALKEKSSRYINGSSFRLQLRCSQDDFAEMTEENFAALKLEHAWFELDEWEAGHPESAVELGLRKETGEYEITIYLRVKNTGAEIKATPGDTLDLSGIRLRLKNALTDEDTSRTPRSLRVTASIAGTLQLYRTGPLSINSPTNEKPEYEESFLPGRRSELIIGSEGFANTARLYWKELPSSYTLALYKVDAQTGDPLAGAKFGLFCNEKQIASATSGQNGYVLFTLTQAEYDAIAETDSLTYRELSAPEGYATPDTVYPVQRAALLRDDPDGAKQQAQMVRNYEKAAPPDLNGKDHVAYVCGYPDGTVRPNGALTRAETATMLYQLLTKERRAEIHTTQNPYQDVSASTWYNEAVSTMTKGGYIAGYPDGTFGGDRSITRAEFVAMLVRFIGVQQEQCSFPDVPASHWAYACIATATQAGWLSGYTDGTFQPDRSITRADAMAIINRVLDRGVSQGSTLLSYHAWPDNDPTAWYYYEIIEATNAHEYTGTRPNENWTKIF